MKNNDYKKHFHEYEKINASPELKKRILHIPSQRKENAGMVRKIVVIGAAAAAVLACVLIICLISYPTGSGNEHKNTVLSEADHLTETGGTGNEQAVIREAGSEQPAAEEKPEETTAEPVELIVRSAEISIPDADDIETPPSEPAYNEIDEQPVIRVADAGMTFEENVPEPAYSEEIVYYQEDLNGEAEVTDEGGTADDAADDVFPDEEPAEDMEPAFDEEPAMGQEPALEKDHDTFTPPPGYDPMLFNDKERPVYESCDHEWVTVVWPDGSEMVECSKCNVTLSMWLYNGYEE